MAEYHYKYTGSTPPNNSNDDLSKLIRQVVEWAVIAIAFSIFWPIGLVLLFRKLNGQELLGRNRRKSHSSTTIHQNTNQYHYTYNYQSSSAAQSAPSGKTQPQTAAEPMKSQVKPRQKNVAPGAMNATFAKPVKSNAGKGFVIAGAITSAVFGSVFLMELVEFLAEWFAGNFWRYMISDMASLACFTGVGLVLLFVGLSRRKKVKRYKQYLSVIGKNREISILSLAKATGFRQKVIHEDLQDMLDEGYLPAGYLDRFEGKLVLTSEGMEEDRAETPSAEAEPKTEEEESRYLIEIKEVNDDIDDPIMSAKIDRIGEITGKILAYQRENPTKAGELRTFLSYYLPTTLKILRSYAQLEDQGIEGENISAAKARIEGMMDKVVDGFEAQLDRLFQNDAMDISADVEVLEKMLEKDGLSDQGMTLGI